MWARLVKYFIPVWNPPAPEEVGALILPTLTERKPGRGGQVTHFSPRIHSESLS